MITRGNTKSIIEIKSFYHILLEPSGNLVEKSRENKIL